MTELHRQGILFCPASGRQYFTLREQFADIADDMVFIAENGSCVVRRRLGGQLRRPDCGGCACG